MHAGIFTGYIGRDAELKFLSSGDPVASFSLAVSVGTKDSKETLWVDCSVWGKRAETLHQYLVRGTPVSVLGDINIRTYTKTDGTFVAVQTCRVDKLTFGGKSPASENTAPVSRPPAPASRQAAPAPVNFDEDVPF
jgi:single-strand DNA-binding protein